MSNLDSETEAEVSVSETFGGWGKKWLVFRASPLFGASDRWQCLLENKTHFVSPSLDKAQITASPQHTHPPTHTQPLEALHTTKQVPSDLPFL